MIRCNLKMAAISVLAYQASRTAIKQAKLLAIRADAKDEMDRLEQAMQEIYNKKRGAAAGREFQELTRQYNKWARVYGKTF